LPHTNHHIRKHQLKAVSGNSTLNCLVAEPKNKQNSVLLEYISRTPKLHLSGKYETVDDIYQQVLLHKIDLIFWDIKLPGTEIFDSLKEAGHTPLIICLATKTEQEKKELNLDIFNFLNRPVSFQNFLATINKIKDYLSTPVYEKQNLKSKKFLFVKSEYKIIKVKFEDILFCEGMKDYTQIYLKGKPDPILTLNNLKLFFSKLPSEEFIRVHRSYIVAISQIDSIARNEIYIDKKIIPIGDSYKEDFYQLIESNS
jgi:DNA-binding LytR/AlgR family response regulator